MCDAVRFKIAPGSSANGKSFKCFVESHTFLMTRGSGVSMPNYIRFKIRSEICVGLGHEEYEPNGRG